MVRVSIHTIMSTTSLCQSHHQVVGKGKSLEAFEFTGENSLVRDTLCFFRVMCISGRRRRVSVSGGAGLDLEELLLKSAQDTGESSVI
jgi:hypothetical protein